MADEPRELITVSTGLPLATEPRQPVGAIWGIPVYESTAAPPQGIVLRYRDFWGYWRNEIIMSKDEPAE